MFLRELLILRRRLEWRSPRLYDCGMDWPAAALRRSVLEQIRINQARTPTERLLALCDLLEAARALAPDDEAARERQRRLAEERARERERFVEFLRQHIAAQRTAAVDGAGSTDDDDG